MIVGVVGAGTMGAGIAQLCLQAGHEVLLHDVDEAAIARGRVRIADGLGRLEAKGRLAAGERDRLLGLLADAHAIGELAGEADVVIEAALESLPLKRTIFSALDQGTRPDALLATNTSALSVTAIAEATTRPERVIGLHFFNPAPLMPLVEVVGTDLSSSAALEQGIEFARALGKTPVACRDAPGFIVNRINRPFTLEALRMAEAGEAGILNIDGAIREAGYPMGPFELMDLVGVDVNLAVAESLYEAFERADRFRPSPIQRELVESGSLGRKTGRGCYIHAGGDPRPDVRWLTTPADASAAAPLTAAAIVERIELAIVNEAYHAVGEEVAQPPDVDRALRLGANHPYGPFERAGALGLAAVVRGLARLEAAHGPRYRVAPALLRVATV